MTREDVAVLDELERTDPEAAREVERLMDRQRRSDERFTEHETVCVDPGDVADQRQARARRTGGGRKCARHPPDD